MLKHDQSSTYQDFTSSDNISQPDLSDKLNEAYAKFYNPFKLLAMQEVSVLFRRTTYMQHICFHMKNNKL